MKPFAMRLLACLPLVWSAAAAASSAREEFKAAWAQAGSRAAPHDSAALRAYPLYPYVQAARLRYGLTRVSPDRRDAALEKRIRHFLESHGDEPVTEELRRDWLRFLGERKAWAEFQEYAPAGLSDLALRCYAGSARLAARDLDGLREEVLALWMTHRDVPQACKPVFAWLDTEERLSDIEIGQRARYAAFERLPLPAALASLPPARRAVWMFWSRLLEQPGPGLERHLSGENLLKKDGLPRPPDTDIAEALVEAFDRVARRDSRHARRVFERLMQLDAFGEQELSRLRRSYALGLAYDFDPEAVEQFDELPESALDALSHEWRVRAALLHREWRRALRWLEALPPPQRQEPRWRYWRARMLERLRDKKAARALYAEVAREREYYAFLAAERLARKPELRPVALGQDPAAQAVLDGLPSMQRAKELFFCDLPELAAAEFRYALRDRPPDLKLQAARLASAWGWHDRSVLLLSELQHWDDLVLRFPLPYAREIEAAARSSGLPADWIYAVLRTESLYNARAASGAGALGLLQLRLPTARQMAQRAGLPRPAREDLFRPEVNIPIGAQYLNELQQRFKGRWILTLAAYNAGPQRIPDWLPDEAVDADIWIENIPYNETRAYVQRALSTWVIVSWRRSGEPAAILPLLQPVGRDREDAAP